MGCGPYLAGLKLDVPVAQTNFALAVRLLAGQREHVVALLVPAFTVYGWKFQIPSVKARAIPAQPGFRRSGRARIAISTSRLDAWSVRDVIKLAENQFGGLPLDYGLVTSGAIADHLGSPFVSLSFEQIRLAPNCDLCASQWAPPGQSKRFAARRTICD